MSEDLQQIAKQAIGLLDLTNLNDDCSPGDIKELCKNAQTEFGNTAAVCIWPPFIPLAADLLRETDIKIATVVNFPGGSTDTDLVVRETLEAVKSSADEIDLVFPYNAFRRGELDVAADQILATRQICLSPVKLKVIIETGELQNEELIRRASLMAIDRGADFIKTSTGKVTENATLKSARIMLNAIKQAGEPVGFKPAGGIKTTKDATDYIQLAAEIMGSDWISPSNLRLGVSSVLQNLLATLKGTDEKMSENY